MSNDTSHADRRRLLKFLGAGSLSALAGCTSLPGAGGGGGNGGGNQSFLQASEQMNFAENLRDRRLATAEEWPIERRRDVPTRDQDTSWTSFGSFESAPWSPPEGWEDTPAGEVEELGIINHGAATMEFDPATLATHELFQEKTGINLNVTEMGVSQANQQEQQIFRAQESTPQIMVVNGALMPKFINRGYLKPVDALYPSEDAWNLYSSALPDMVQTDIGPTYEGTHAYGFPNINEITLGHLRPDALEEQGIDPARFQGGWSWDLLEETMQAFEGTDMFGYCYFAGTGTYLSYSWRRLLYAQGGQMRQDDGTIRMDTPAAIRATRKMAEWYQKGWVPSGVVSFTEGDIVDLFLSGNLAYTSAYSGLVPTALNEYEQGREYAVVAPPRATAGPNPAQRPLAGPNATAINTFSDTAHSLAALLYGDLRLSYTSQWWEYTYERNAAFMGRVYEDAAEYNFTPFAEVFARASNNSTAELFPGMQNLFAQMTTPIQDAIQGRRSPEEAMQDIQNWVDENLNQDSG